MCVFLACGRRREVVASSFIAAVVSAASLWCLQCVVQSYLRWLEDADYDPVCVLCTKSIQEGGDVVRLVCYGEYSN